MILSGALDPGTALPTEPELANQYGVSRAVIRDATRLLLARGLVDVRHGRGVFVTHSQSEAFGDALLLALRRAGATAWDLQEFENLLFPAVIELIAERATSSDLAEIRGTASEYLEQFEATSDAVPCPDGAGRAVEQAFARFLMAVYAATHNPVILQIGEQLTSLRRARKWMHQNEEEVRGAERTFLTELLAILEARDSKRAGRRVAKLLELPPEAMISMQHTPIGDVPRIDVRLYPGRDP